MGTHWLYAAVVRHYTDSGSLSPMAKKQQGKKPDKRLGGDRTAAELRLIANHTTKQERAEIIKRARTSPGAKHRTFQQQKEAASAGLLSRAKRNQKKAPPKKTGHVKKA